MQEQNSKFSYHVSVSYWIYKANNMNKELLSLTERNCCARRCTVKYSMGSLRIDITSWDVADSFALLWDIVSRSYCGTNNFWCTKASLVIYQYMCYWVYVRGAYGHLLFGWFTCISLKPWYIFLPWGGCFDCTIILDSLGTLHVRFFLGCQEIFSMGFMP